MDHAVNALPPEWFPQIPLWISIGMYWASSSERHLRRGSEKPFLYRTAPNKVDHAALFITLRASINMLGSLPPCKNFIMSVAHFRDAEAMTDTLASMAGRRPFWLCCDREGGAPPVLMWLSPIDLPSDSLPSGLDWCESSGIGHTLHRLAGDTPSAFLRLWQTIPTPDWRQLGSRSSPQLP